MVILLEVLAQSDERGLFASIDFFQRLFTAYVTKDEAWETPCLGM